jgi:hypothetical protein
MAAISVLGTRDQVRGTRTRCAHASVLARARTSRTTNFIPHPSSLVPARLRQGFGGSLSLTREREAGRVRARQGSFRFLLRPAGALENVRVRTRPVSRPFVPDWRPRSCWLASMATMQGPWLLLATSRFSASACSEACWTLRFHAPQAMRASFAFAQRTWQASYPLCGPVRHCHVRGLPQRPPSLFELRRTKRRLPRRPLS